MTLARRAAIAALCLSFTLLAHPATAEGWPDKLDGFTQLAKAAQQAGNLDGAKSVVLAGLPTFVNIMQQNAMHIPRNRSAAQGFNDAAEAIYKGHPVGDDDSAFQKVLAELGPGLLEDAEVMHLPNGSARNQLAMLLRAKQEQEAITARAVAYVKAAPGPAAHMKEPAAKKILGAIAAIISGLAEGAPRTQSVIDTATKTGNEVVDWAESALTKDNLFHAMAHARRAAEIAEGLLAIDASNAAGKTIADRAEVVKQGVAKKYEAQVAKNRMPDAGFKGGAGLEKELLALYRKTFPKEKPVKLVIVSSDWVDEVRADWSESAKRWKFTRYKMLSEVAVSVARKDGKKLRYWVNFMRAYKVWNGKKFGPTQITPIGGYLPYEVQAKHAR